MTQMSWAQIYQNTKLNCWHLIHLYIFKLKDQKVAVWYKTTCRLGIVTILVPVVSLQPFRGHEGDGGGACRLWVIHGSSWACLYPSPAVIALLAQSERATTKWSGVMAQAVQKNKAAGPLVGNCWQRAERSRTVRGNYAHYHAFHLV